MVVDEAYLLKLWEECGKLPPPDYIVVSVTAWNAYTQILHRGYVARRCFRRNGKKVINWGVMR